MKAGYYALKALCRSENPLDRLVYYNSVKYLSAVNLVGAHLCLIFAVELYSVGILTRPVVCKNIFSKHKFTNMSYVIEGTIIDHWGKIPVVPDSAIKKTSAKGKKPRVVYTKISEDRVKSVKKNTTRIGQRKKKESDREVKSETEKPKKLTPYQIFNLAVKEKKSKDKSFSLTVGERSERWAKISEKVASGKIKPTKKDIRAIVSSW